MGWYFTITEDMRALGLAGNALVVYAVIHGFSQDGDGCYYGTQARLCEICGVKERALRGILADLVDDGLLLREPVVVDGQARVSYRVPAKNAAPGKNCRTPGKNCRPVPPIPPAPPITPITQDIYTPVGVYTPTAPSPGAGVREGDASRKKFTVPSLSEVRDYWAAAGLKRNPDEFYDHFEANGWKVGGTTPMKDWRAAARNWARREEYRRPAPAKQETFLDAARRTAQRLGIAPEAYTTKTPDYDEQ
ncbi:MAG: helix-turn-helix domain-containing protein [Clostridia bacterium]|nr:helix-turn-helix domain-containing protein [Clostridia bacterium]